MMPERRGSGIPGDIMDHVHEHARAKGLLQAELTAQSGNARAVRFYERLCFCT